MRANTSLISHILGSHPQISGYYEMHLSYRSKKDLLKQQQLLLLNKELQKKISQGSSQYLFDKILHNDYQLLLENLSAEPGSDKIKILVSIRPAEQTIKSIINLFRNKKTRRSYAEPEAATGYYIHRIRELARFCERYKGLYYYYDADLIRTNPQSSLSLMQNWLSLTTPLTEDYQVFSLTGKPRVGDSSINMKKGQIIKHQTNYDEIKMPSQLVHKAVTETRQYRRRIIAHAMDSITGTDQIE